MRSSSYWFGENIGFGVPNTLTAVRLVLAIAMGSYALVERDLGWLIGAYAVYWVGDMLDGAAARMLHQETRFGAVFDILSDRASTAVLACGLLTQQPNLWVAIVVFLISFMVVDCSLSLSFLVWDLMGPNSFLQIDHRTWLLNWSPIAKAINTASVAIAVVAGWALPALLLASSVLCLKLWSVRRTVTLIRSDVAAAPAA